MPDLGCDEAVPRLLSHGRRARLGDGAHGPLHRLRVDRMRRDLHRSVHDVQQLGITEVPHERRLAERFSSAYYKSIISPAYQFRVDRGVEVDGGDGENPAAVLRLLLARGADQPHRPLADRAVPVGDHSQEKLLRVGPEAVLLDDRPDYRLRVLRQLAEQRHSQEQILWAPVAAAVPPDMKPHRHVVADHELDQFPQSTAGCRSRHIDA